MQKVHNLPLVVDCRRINAYLREVEISIFSDAWIFRFKIVVPANWVFEHTDLTEQAKKPFMDGH